MIDWGSVNSPWWYGDIAPQWMVDAFQINGIIGVHHPSSRQIVHQTRNSHQEQEKYKSDVEHN